MNDRAVAWLVPAALVAALALSAVSRAADADEAPAEDVPAENAAVAVDGDRVTAAFDETSPATVVQSIADAAGAEVIGGTAASDPVTLELDDVPIDRALERALTGQSFTIVYAADGSVRRIRLHGGPQAAPPVASGTAAKQTATRTRGVRLTPQEILRMEVKVPSVGPLAEHLGSETATVAELYDIAVESEQAALRIGAIDAAMAGLDGDTDVQESVEAILNDTTDELLVSMVRSSAGDRANELVSRILSRTRRPSVRQRAVNLLRELRRPTS